MIFCRSELSLTILYGFTSCEVSSLIVKPAISSKHPTTAPLTVLVIVHRFLAFTHCVKAAIPVCLEDASLFTVCSSVKSTELRENDFEVRRIERAPPGWLTEWVWTGHR